MVSDRAALRQLRIWSSALALTSVSLVIMLQGLNVLKAPAFEIVSGVAILGLVAVWFGTKRVETW
jgi:hypothetical protein